MELLTSMEALSAPETARMRDRIEEAIERDRTEAQAWLAEHWYELDTEIETSEIIRHDPSETWKVVLDHTGFASEEDYYLPTSDVPNFTAQPLELLYEWRGRKHMGDNLSAILPCVEIRWSFGLRVGEERLNGPWEKTRRIPATIRNITARASSDGVRSLKPRNADGTRKHAPAGSGAVRIEHDCHNWCDCWKDWQPFVHWRPWNDPAEEEIRRWEEKLLPHGLLTNYLKDLLWEHRQTEPQKPGEVYKDKRTVKYFPLPHLGKTVDRVYMWPQGVLNVPKIGPRIQQDRRYIKVWWQFFRQGAETKKPQKSMLSDVICSPSGKVPKRIGIDVEFTITKNDPVEDVRYYRTHESAEDVMSFFSCSRATAFRRIQEGFRIPEELKTVTTSPMATTAHRLTLRILAGGGYMKLTPGPAYTGSGCYTEGILSHPDLPTAPLPLHCRAQAITKRRSEIPIDHYQVWLDRKGWLV